MPPTTQTPADTKRRGRSLVSDIAEATGLTAADVQSVLTEYRELTLRDLRSHGKASLPGLGVCRRGQFIKTRGRTFAKDPHYQVFVDPLLANKVKNRIAASLAPDLVKELNRKSRSRTPEVHPKAERMVAEARLQLSQIASTIDVEIRALESLRKAAESDRSSGKPGPGVGEGKAK